MSAIASGGVTGVRCAGLVLAAAALSLGGCGGDEETATSTQRTEPDLSGIFTSPPQTTSTRQPEAPSSPTPTTTTKRPGEQTLRDAQDSARLLDEFRDRIQSNVSASGRPQDSEDYCRSLKLKYANRYGGQQEITAALGENVYGQMRILCPQYFVG